jgi:hypothetical protein
VAVLDAVLVAELARAEHDREVELAAAQLGHRVLGLVQRERQVDPGMALAEGGDGQRHQRRGGGLEGGHP